MESSDNCPSVRYANESCLRLGRDFLHPVGDRSVPVNSQGALFSTGTQSALNFRLLRLVQVNSLLDNRKPSRRNSLFGGHFSFSFPFVITVIHFLLLPFFLAMVSIHSLSKTRNPDEHGYNLLRQSGNIVHKLDDGYSLIEFPELLVEKQVSFRDDYGRRVNKCNLVPLQWYVHQSDYA